MGVVIGVYVCGGCRAGGCWAGGRGVCGVVQAVLLWRCGSWRSVSGRVDATNGVGVLQVVSSSCMYSPECIMVDDARVEAGGVLSVGVACCVQYCVFWVSR